MNTVQTTHIEIELQELSALVSQLGGSAEEQLGRALEAMSRRDAELARSVIAVDKKLDALETSIDEKTSLILSRRQPMAADLRMVLSSIKVASALERVGDLAKNTARRSVTLTGNGPLKLVAPVVRLGQETMRQLSEALDAFMQRDIGLAKDVWRQDAELDTLYNGLMRDIIAEMEQAPDKITLYTQLMFIAKNMERIGDHATFIAEMAHYVVTNDGLQEDRPKGAPDGSPEALTKD